MSITYLFFVTSLLISSVFLSSCQEEHVLFGNTMGTTYSIKSDVVLSKSEVQGELDAVNALFSQWQTGSEVNRMNAHDDTTPFSPSKEFLYLLMFSKQVHDQTSGYFDITLGALIELWGFGAQNVTIKPTKKQVQQARNLSGFKYLTTQNNVITKLQNIQLNFSAIAKGYAVDKISELLLAKGSVDFVVEIGGEVRVGGTKRIGIERVNTSPYPVQITHEAIATSGDYRNVRIFDDESFTHIIDPFTGYPSKSDLVSVSIIHENATMADAYATALLAMGSEKAVRFIQKNTLKSILINKHNILTTHNVYQ